MNLKQLIQKGYFPKELPPPFRSDILAKKLNGIRRSSPGYSSVGPSESKTIKYTLPKGKFSRRKLEIPHPKHFLELSENIVSNWSNYSSIFSLSNYSESLPSARKKSKRSIDTKSKSLNEFRLGLLKMAYDKLYELKFDISQFYPTVYTHSITWAILGKEDAKRYFKLKRIRNRWPGVIATDPKARLYESADKLDTLVRNCQEKQSIGLPIGPDTSFILAELIACRLDSEIKAAVGYPIAGSRYYDDYYFYVNSRSEAEIILKQAQRIVNDYKLDLNESKVAISEAPFTFEYEWANTLSAFRFKKVDQFELRSFFDLVFRLISKFPNDSGQISHYAMQRFEFGNVPIKKNHWQTFMFLMLHLQLKDASNLDQVLKILLSYRVFLNKKNIDSIRLTVESIIEKHLLLNHSFEVSWSLWIMASLKIKCKSNLLVRILDSQDCISKLICLDILDRKLFTGRKPKTGQIFKSFIQEDLYGDSWVFVYESVYKGWIARSNFNFLTIDPFIKALSSTKTEFYLPTNQIEIEFLYDPNSKDPVIPTKQKVLTKQQQLELLYAASIAAKY